jgi:hypothetical protein
MFELTKYEWIAIGVTIALVVVVNKLVIQDQGNTWAGLAAISFLAGLGLVHVRRWIQARHV